MLIFAASSTALAQDKDLNGMAGWAWGSAVNVINGKMKIEDDVAYSATLGVEAQRNTKIELSWIYHPTNLRFTPFTGPVSSAATRSIAAISATTTSSGRRAGLWSWTSESKASASSATIP